MNLAWNELELSSKEHFPKDKNTPSPGARVIIRDEEWLVRSVEILDSKAGHYQLTCEGISELVSGHEGIFLTELDKVDVIDPANTKLELDESQTYIDSLLYIESQLRERVNCDDQIQVGELAAMDHAPYQYEPARLALSQPRQRILIADAVGLGKTMEAGVLVSELIARGRGKRILVLAIKSMLVQFQKEFWNRFTIPLTRLDSVGIQRIRRQIPSNHNPFYYYDKAIISIDTLKQSKQYRDHLEKAYWDIIIIDEAHNVANRGTKALRNKLATLLSTRSDTLIMLSATPHDGNEQSFNSLIQMLDPTVDLNPDKRKAEKYKEKGLVVRRFKKDIVGQVQQSFRDREVLNLPVQASDEEEGLYDDLLAVREEASQHKHRTLFGVTLEKALFSSPAACIESISKRLKVIQGHSGERRREIDSLNRLKTNLEGLDDASFSKYQRLLELLKDSDFGWKPNNPKDRLVIFTERIATMEWLAARLAKDLRLKGNQINTLHGGMIDTEQQRVVEQFGNEKSEARLLICSDVASEGINLHYFCHRLIHFDIPWSLMVFQQRNGRVDRYGQEEVPTIVYFATECQNETIKGDLRILEILKEKDNQAYKDIGDPSVFMNVRTVEKEEEVTQIAMAKRQDANAFNESLNQKPNKGDDLLRLFIRGGGGKATFRQSFSPVVSLFDNDLIYLTHGLSRLNSKRSHPQIQFEVNDDKSVVELHAPPDLRQRFRFFPKEVKPDYWRFILTIDYSRMSEAIDESRRAEKNWPTTHFLWRQSPIFDWLHSQLMSLYGRSTVPVLAGLDGLEHDESAFLFSGMIPNGRGQSLKNEWICVLFRKGRITGQCSFEKVRQRINLGVEQIANTGSGCNIDDLQDLVPSAAEEAKAHFRSIRDSFELEQRMSLNELKSQLIADQNTRLDIYQKERDESRKPVAIAKGEYENKHATTENIFTDSINWLDKALTSAENPWVQLICVFTAEG